MGVYNLWKNKDCFTLFLHLYIHFSQTFSHARGFLGLQWFSIWYLQWRSFTWSDEHVKVSRSTSGHGVTAHLRFKIICSILSQITLAEYFRVNRVTKQVCPKVRNVLINLLWNSLSIYLKNFKGWKFDLQTREHTFSLCPSFSAHLSKERWDG